MFPSRKTFTIIAGIFLVGIAIFLWRNQFVLYRFSLNEPIISKDAVSSLGKNLEDGGMLDELNEAFKSLESIDWSKFSTTTKDTNINSATATFDLNSATTISDMATSSISSENEATSSFEF